MRKRNSNSTTPVVATAVLCGLFIIQSAWADSWSVSSPIDHSVRTKTSNVAGSGLTDAPDTSQATFQFRVPNPNAPGGWATEREVTVIASTMSWSGNLEPPAAGWQVSPTDEMGMYVGDHRAVIKWPNGTFVNWTSDHVVTD